MIHLSARPLRLRRVALALLAGLTACSSSPEASPSARELLVVVNVPVQRDPSLAQEIENGARLAVEQINAAGGVKVGDGLAHLRIEVKDSELSPTTTAANVRNAISDGAVALIDEGTGVDAAWTAARDASLPICITYQSGAEHIDPSGRPNVFRIAPTDRGMAFRLAEYLVPKGHRLAVMTDDSTEGTAGDQALGRALARNPEAVAATIRLPAAETSVDAQVLQARQSGATALVLWMRPALMARVIRSARGSGWNVPVFASIAAENPVLRQQLADHPEWLDGLTFTMSRLTSEKGPEPFETFWHAYEARFGKELVGVTSGGHDVVQIPDWAMYSYDFVHVLAAAIEQSGATKPSSALVTALEAVEVQGANGDERAFNVKSHEGVVDDDVFFARFEGMLWVPVTDDPLSSTLPSLPQTGP
jgi:branched-chain amino acid transport system substrate-binding protein